MNSPSPISPDNDATSFGGIDASESASPPREGLPAGFRMRNAHYVDQLESPPRPTLKSLAVSAIDGGALRDAPESLVASIRKYGVLEPLVVQQSPRGRHYKLMTGRGRLAAARAAGLKEVPCLVLSISDAEASELMDAARGTNERPTALASPPAPAAIALYPAQRDLEAALTTIESCAPMLNQASVPARRAAFQVIAAECRRSQRLLTAIKVLTDGVAMHRARLKPGDLLTRVAQALRDEQRLLGSEPVIHLHSEPQLAFYGDDQLLAAAMTNVLSALTAAAGDRARDVTITAVAQPATGTLALELSDRSVVLPETFVRTAFATAWPVPEGDTVLLMLLAARRILAMHNGSIALFSDTTRTTVRLQLPADQLPRPN